MIKAVVFDMDGTLLDTESVYQRVWRETAKEFGIEESRIDRAVNECSGRNPHDTRLYFEENLADMADYDEFVERRRVYYDAEIERIGGIPLKAGVKELMDCLKGQGMLIALATATRRERTMDNLEKTGLISYFDAIITGDMVTNGKPHPETFLTAAAALGVKPEECIGVEDSFHGVRAIHASGMVTVMIPDVKQPTPEIAALVDHQCENLLQVGDILQQLNQSGAN